MDTVYACLQDTLDRTPLPQNGIQISSRFLSTLTANDLDFMAAHGSALPPDTARRLWRSLGRSDPLPDSLIIVVSQATANRIKADKKHGTIRLTPQ